MKTCVAIPLFVASILPHALARAEEPSAGKQVERLLESTKVDGGKLPYLMFLPKEYESKEAWPVILFLHGAGERGGGNLPLVKKHGPPKIVDEKADFPFIVVSPQCPTGQWWTDDALQKMLIEMLDGLESEFKVDKSRVYLTGLSMGGFGSWKLAAEHPDRFAAVAPICGGGDPKTAEPLKSVPIWVFHGAKDSVVPLKRSEEMVEAVKAAGGKVELTVYPEAGHDSWTETYNNPKLYDWLMEHTAKR